MEGRELEHRHGEHPHGDAGQLALLIVFLAVWGLDSFVLRISTGLSRFVPLPVRLGAGAVLLGLSIALVGAAHPFIGHGERSPGVVTTGPFRLVRHPLYLGCVLFYLALAVATASLLSLIAWLVIALFYGYIAGYEERLLESRYEDEYRRYRESTGKWIPRPRRGAAARR